MPYDESRAARIRSLLESAAGVSEKRLFGGIAFLKHGHMFAGVTGSDLMARVGKDAYAASLARKHVREMNFTGKSMTGYVFVGGAGTRKDADLQFWLAHCEAFVQTLPPKPKR
jgi:hypothetical protein